MPTDGPADRVFPIRLERRLRPILLLFGVRSGNAWVRLEPDRLVARFGWSGAEIPIADIEWWDITGPYNAIRAVGIRNTLGKSDISYGGSAHGGLRVHFRHPKRIAWIKANELYVTVDDLEGLAAALAARGIPGEDRRRSR